MNPDVVQAGSFDNKLNSLTASLQTQKAAAQQAMAR